MKKSISDLIEISDVLQFTGLTLIGVGLFFCYGIGVSLSVVGTLLLSMGFFSGAIKGKK